MNREYQLDFSNNSDEMFNSESRVKKAKTMIAVLNDHISNDLNKLFTLNIGGSAGFIDEYLSHYFASVTGIDIDSKAIEHAKNNFNKDNLTFEVGDAMNLQYESNKFDVAVCSQVYEHVPDAEKMISEIYRVLKPGGVCYFAAGNRLMLTEPHYNLPFLSLLPRFLAHFYVRLAGKGPHYYEKHLTYWGLKKLVKNFNLFDYTRTVIIEPKKYATDYMLKTDSIKHKLACFIAKHALWLSPGYIWLLQKPIIKKND